MINNLAYTFVGICDLKTNVRMQQFKNPEHFIRESLADSINVPEIE